MNEFIEKAQEIPSMNDISPVPEYPDFSFENLMNEINDFISDTNDFIEDTTSDDAKETVNEREYGLKECTDAAKGIFTKDVIKDWNKTDLEQRQNIVREYSDAIGQGLNIDFKGVVFEDMKAEQAGYNTGDGDVYLNNDLLKDPNRVADLINTVAHEARHQFQREAIWNPEKFGIDEATVKEWTVGFETYTEQAPTAYDPWGYHNNPVELDARYFGESMIRELRKDLINKDPETDSGVIHSSITNETVVSSHSDMVDAKYYHDAVEKEKKMIADALKAGDYSRAQMYQGWLDKDAALEKLKNEQAQHDLKKK
jgi:hypothetical protein